MGGSRGGEWIASHPPLEQLTKKNIPKYNAWKNIRKYVGPKEIEKTTGDNIFHGGNLLRKRGHIMRPALLLKKPQ